MSHSHTCKLLENACACSERLFCPQATVCFWTLDSESSQPVNRPALRVACAVVVTEPGPALRVGVPLTGELTSSDTN